MRSGSNIGSEAIEPQLIQIPDCDEDLEEDFTGPFQGELDESYGRI